ncbi:MAG: hypothetical protein L0H70_07275, partial [Xanthomonadales bacterium]|nr:hypothetical protein [Xanthomonadales bacterium]
MTALFAWFAAAMLGLAAGAVWMVVALYAQAAYPWVVSAWLALPTGALLALAIRQWIWPHGVVAATMAAFATLLAAAYLSLLLAAIRLGGAIGINILDAMRSAGLNMLASLARLAITPADVIWFVLGAALVVWTARGYADRRSRPSTGVTQVITPPSSVAAL